MLKKFVWVALSLLVFIVGCASCGTQQQADDPNGKSLKKVASGLMTCQTCPNVTPQHPVILVHGRGDSPARWDTLVANWSNKGFTENTNLFRISLASYCGSNTFCTMLAAPDGTGATYVNESYAKCLKRYIDEKVPCVPDGDGGTSCPTVDIVTHSQGGVVARYYTQFLSAPRQVDDLVLMSATHNGITNCTLAGSCTGVNPEVCPDSPFLRKLNGVAPQGDGSNDMTPNGLVVHYSATVSTGDKTVPPWCGSYFISNPQTQQGDDLSCSGSGNYTLDPDADACKLTNVQHLAVPTNATAINDAYCKVTD
jgi:pimeloyl-ACP methyl ester carboxylesterase